MSQSEIKSSMTESGSRKIDEGAKGKAEPKPTAETPTSREIGESVRDIECDDLGRPTSGK